MHVSIGLGIGNTVSEGMWTADLLSGALPDGVEFTRPSSGWCYNSSGVLVEGLPDVPRFNHDPATLQPRGLLREGARTNLALRSGEIAGTSPWAYVNATGASNVVVSPNGTQDADELFWTLTSSWGGSRQTMTTTSGATYSASVFAKKNTNTILRLNVFDTTDRYALFDLNAGTYGTNTNIISSFMENVGNGWYRCSITFTSTATSTQLQMRFNSGSAGSSFYVWGAQLEAGVHTSSYIPTTSTSVTRAEDVLTIPDLSTIGFNPNEGTFVIEYELLNATNIAFARYFQVDGGSDSVGMRLRCTGLGVGNNFEIVGGTGGTMSTGDSSSFSGIAKSGCAYKQNDSATCKNGGTIHPDTAVGIPTGLTTLRFGNSANGSLPLFLNLRRMTYTPQRINDASFQAMTVL